MSDYDRDRGAYAPSGEAPLAFDARDPSGRGAGRPPTTLIISALILLVVVLALFLMYVNGPRRAGQPPVVGQPVGDMRQAPSASSQPSDETAHLQIYGAGHDDAAASAAPAFAPGPEQPLPRAAQSPPPPPAAASVPAAEIANAQPAPVAALPVARPTPAAPAPKPELAPPPAQAVAAAPAAEVAGLAVVQIGAFSSAALADKGWSDVAKLIPGQMVGRTKKVETFAKGAETFYRAYVGGFGSKAEASGFCTQLKTAGHDCIVK